MISFSWTAVSPNVFQIHIKTPVVRVGTLHRLAAAMYILGLNVESGDVDTVTESGVEMSDDRFVLSSPRGQSAAETSARLGVLMEALLRGEKEPDVLFAEHNTQPPDPRDFFETRPDILFQPDGAFTQFYFESADRRGLLLHLTRSLAKLGINIVKAKIRSSPFGAAQDTFYLQFGGAPLSEKMSRNLENAILGKADDAPA